jgi:hypothetical protein
VGRHCCDTVFMAPGRQREAAAGILRGWVPLVALPAVTLIVAPPTWPRWGLMWALALAVYAGCKWLSWRRARARQASAWRQVGYLLAWPGLDADAFFGRTCVPSPTAGEWAFAAGKLMLGLAMLMVVARHAPADWPYVAGWAGMVGIVLALHFGVFHLLSCAWRSAGVEARPLMDWPAASAGVSEFWGRRWNRAFRDLTHRFLFRPLTQRLGAAAALVVGFLISGLVHELVISLPAGSGYGGPTAYFLAQAAAILAERSRLGHTLGLGHGVRGRLFTMLVVLGPVCWLFHRPFVEGVVVPMLRGVGHV